jgi:DnaK suppressor protein
MTKKDLLKFEKRLLEKKTQILRQRGYTGAILLKPDDGADAMPAGNPADIGDQGYDTYARELASRLTSEQTKMLMEIDEALRRVVNKTYGICEKCGKPIPKARLELVPQARFDVKCLKLQESQVVRPPARCRRR